jgi:PAS domain S-box-containing protein
MKTDGDTPEQSDDGLKQIIAELTERNKELHCLITISTIIEQQRHSLEGTLQQVVDILPSAWQDPQSTCAQIIFEDQIFTTDSFVETPWRQTCDLLVKGTPAGSVVICRLENGIKNNSPPFLKEETDLLRAVAERLGKMIERRQAERALQKSEQRFRNLVENSITGISIVQNNQVIYQNKEQEKLLGSLPRMVVLGDFKNIHPDDVETVMQANHDIQRGKVPKQDLDFRLFPASDASSTRVLKRVFCRITFIDYQGRESILVNMIDMTKMMELEKLLFRQDKMASLGRVAAGIAHEIRNPLSGINIYLDTLEKLVDRPDSRPKVLQVIDQLQSASRKIESVIRKVMDFAKPGKPNFVHIQINKPVANALNLTAVTMRKSGIVIEKDFADNIPVCYADSHFIEEAVLNLINNAAEAMQQMEAGKKIAVITRVKGNHIFIEVSDSGPGVPIDLRNKVFDPFFTTKNDGTGIGLSLCHRIARDHQGVLTIGEGALGGAAFRLEIPIRKDAHSSD